MDAIDYPPVGFHFSVGFGFLNQGAENKDVHFSEVSGISSELGVENYDEAGESRYTHRLPGKPKYGNLSLKRGLLADSALILWFRNAIENFEVETTNVTVTLLNSNHEPLSAWEFVNCWPQKWSVDAFNAQQSQVVVESIDLVYAYFKRIL